MTAPKPPQEMWAVFSPKFGVGYVSNLRVHCEDYVRERVWFDLPQIVRVEVTVRRLVRRK
jgi:hypothetical protein